MQQEHTVKQQTTPESCSELEQVRARLQEVEAAYQAAQTDAELKTLYRDFLLAHSPSLTFLFNEELTLLYCSTACERFMNPAGAIACRGKSFVEVFTPTIETTWLAMLQYQCQDALSCRESCTYDDTIPLSDNRKIPARISISPILDNAGVSRGLQLSWQDLSQQMATKNQTEEVARAKSIFMTNMSHEMRTPMNAIKGLSELLSLTKLDDMQRNYVYNIISSSNSLISVINDMLDYTKIDMDRIILLESTYKLNELLSEVGHVASMRASERSLQLLIDVPADTPASLCGDFVRVRQVIVHLLSNAIKYTQKGFVRLELHIETTEHGTFLVCSVQDSGPGIREEDIPSLFNAYARSDLHTNPFIIGAGLGLTISKRLVDAMGGEISATSVMGQGSTFRFSIPQTAVGDAPLAKVQMPEQKRVLLLGEKLMVDSIAAMLGSLHVPCQCLYEDERLDTFSASGFTHCIYDAQYYGQPIEEIKQALEGCDFASISNMRTALATVPGEANLLSPVLITELARYLNKDLETEKADQFLSSANPSEEFMVKNTSLLVVDDNEINLMVSSEMLRLFGAEVVLADSGEAALRLCEKRKFDLIFLDHMMPGMDGLTVTKELRAHSPINQQTPIVALTANVEGDNMQAYYARHGLDDFIGKPFEFSDLARILLRWLPIEKIVLTSPHNSF